MDNDTITISRDRLRNIIIDAVFNAREPDYSCCEDESCMCSADYVSAYGVADLVLSEIDKENS